MCVYDWVRYLVYACCVGTARATMSIQFNSRSSVNIRMECNYEVKFQMQAIQAEQNMLQSILQCRSLNVLHKHFAWTQSPTWANNVWNWSLQHIGRQQFFEPRYLMDQGVMKRAFPRIQTKKKCPSAAGSLQSVNVCDLVTKSVHIL